MKKIRSNVFETNSSSVHALCIVKNNTENIDEVLYNLKKLCSVTTISLIVVKQASFSRQNLLLRSLNTKQ